MRIKHWGIYTSMYEEYQVEIPQVAVCDQPFFPDDRRPFLRYWIGQPSAVALGLMQGASWLATA
jgi:hypothetical protein